MDEHPKAWLFSHGGWQEIDDPGAQGYRAHDWYDLDLRWGYPPILLFTGREGAPYPYALDVNHYMQKVYAADFPRYAQLLERLAPIVLADTLGDHAYARSWRLRQKQQKKLQKQLKKLKKAKAKAQHLPPTG